MQITFFVETYACDVTKKITNTMVFAIEVILIKNTEINYTDNTQNESNNYDWTISCTYDQKVTHFKFTYYFYLFIFYNYEIQIKTKQHLFIKKITY